MANKYKFNPETFSVQHESKTGKILKIILTQVVSIVFIALVVFYGLSFFTDSPLERNLKYENDVLKQQYEDLVAIYKSNEKGLQELEKQDKQLYQIIFGTSETPEGDEEEEKRDYSDYTPRALNKKNYKDLKKMLDHLAETKQEYLDFLEDLKQKADLLKNIPSIQPVCNPNNSMLLYGFGYRLDPIYRTPQMHNGIDFSTDMGTPVFATADGTVTLVDNASRLKGKIIEINHNDYTTSYFHLEKIIIKQGQKVKKGQHIGYVGTTGKSLIPHLHYEVKYKGKNVNPIFFFYTDLNPSQFYSFYQRTAISGISLD